jgi:hypothetical protein
MRFLDDYSQIWSNLLPMAELKEELSMTLVDLNVKLQEQHLKNPKGYTQAKNAAMATMNHRAIRLALKLKSYAKRTNNPVLKQMVDFSESELEIGSDIEKINRCRFIAETATQHLTQLTAYLVTDLEIDALTEAIGIAAPITAQRDSLTGERRSVTGTIQELFEKAQGQITDIDDLVKCLVSEENSNFISGYFSVRRINNRRGSSSKKEAIEMDMHKEERRA